MPEAPPRVVEYADPLEIEAEVLRRYPQPGMEMPDDDDGFNDEEPMPPPVLPKTPRRTPPHTQKSTNLKT